MFIANIVTIPRFLSDPRADDRIAVMQEKVVPHEPTQQELTVAGQSLMPRLIEQFPRFKRRWSEHLAFWNGEVAGAFNDIAAFAHFLDDELFLYNQQAEVRKALLLIERLFNEGDQATRNLIGIGLIEDLQNITSHRHDGHATLIPYLPETLRKVWDEVARMWAGHSSLADVVRAERAKLSDNAVAESPLRRMWRRLRRQS